ncbi:MAG: VWA domain-containing protein, partial [Rhodospirillales bacterium]|nr:VWA domain-containing protein [Rhodospirillales bacterium]
DIKMVPERHNSVKVLLMLDIGGSMDFHVKTCAELFSAARTEFKHLEHYYFHNCLYERVWKDNSRHQDDMMATWDLMNTYPSDYKLIFVGDATMSPYEITYPGGSVEHWNEEPGSDWMRRILDIYSRAIWLNPVPEKYWNGTASLQLVRQLMGGRMYPLTLDGLDRGMRELSR